MTTPIPHTNPGNVPEVLEESSSSAYVPYPREGIQDEHAHERLNPKPSVGVPEPNKREYIENGEERCALVLVLDRSSSMAGVKAQRLNEQVAQFKRDLMENSEAMRKIDVAVNEFNNLSRYRPFETAETWQPPFIETSGGTLISYALEVAMDAVAQRKDDYRMNGVAYHRPWIVLMTDGYPGDSESQLDAIGKRVRKDHDEKRFNLFTIIIDDDRNNAPAVSIIRDKITPPGRPPKRTDSEHFKELFEWLSNSMTAVSRSTPTDQIMLEDTSGWGIA